MGLRLLHVWNTAGVGSVIAKFVDRKFGTRSSVITRKAFDPVGLTSYGKAYDDGAVTFFARAVLSSLCAGVTHVHSLDRILPWVKTLSPRKPAIAHYHGTDIEGRWKEKEERWRRADAVAYSTPNLSEGAPDRAFYAPNPVDTDVFYPRGPGKKGSALSIRYGEVAEAQQAAKKMGLELTLVDRWSVPHSEMPLLLSHYEYYLDLRKPEGRGEAHSVGKTALEALACGCKVVDWSGNVHEGLPPDNLPDRVAERWYRVYLELLER